MPAADKIFMEVEEGMVLMSMPLVQEQDVVECRHKARTVAAHLRFDRQDQTRIATAVSEIARNAFRYAKHATAELWHQKTTPTGAMRAVPRLVCIIRDRGTGIEQLPEILAGTFRSTSGMGKGIVGAQRLMDDFQIATGPDGTTVTMSKNLARGVDLTASALTAIVQDLGQSRPTGPLEDLAAQNEEVLRSLDVVRAKQEELSRINEELSETNRGVVALYDELDTISRVGREVANKLDFESLFQAITDATTEISGAELGAFFHEELNSTRMVLQSLSGVLREAVHKPMPVTLPQLFGVARPTEVLRVADLEAAKMPSPFGDLLPLHSYLAVPIFSGERVAGALVFGHRSASYFTDRSERILPSVAVQASIGLDNARLYQSVQAANAAKDQFLATLSHELRTPLNPVMSALTLLEEQQGQTVETREILTVMRRNLQLEARLIDDLLDLTRISKGKVSLYRERVDVHELIRLVCGICDEVIKAGAVVVKLRLDAVRRDVSGDAARLQQVFWNVLNNAVKFTPPQGSIDISTSEGPDDVLVIHISDTGRGIDSKSLEKIFTPFEQGDTTVAREFGGLGLGLAIVRSIIEGHDGQIRAASEGSGRGATFSITLPLLPVSDEMKVSVHAVKPSKTAQGLRILYVDDHDDSRSILKRMLANRGHQVELAGSCQEALAKAAQQPFDLVISDLGLPDGSGHDLMRSLSAEYRLPGIAVSGYGSQQDRKNSESAGFSAHLTKPLDFPALLEAIAKVSPRVIEGAA